VAQPAESPVQHVQVFISPRNDEGADDDEYIVLRSLILSSVRLSQCANRRWRMSEVGKNSPGVTGWRGRYGSMPLIKGRGEARGSLSAPLIILSRLAGSVFTSVRTFDEFPSHDARCRRIGRRLPELAGERLEVLHDGGELELVSRPRETA
jgi:hypothetical protein